METTQKSSLPHCVDRARSHDIFTLQIALPDFYQSLELDREDLWQEFMEKDQPAPPKFLNVTPFQFILLVQALRPDKLYSAMIRFAVKALDIASLSPKSVQMNELFEVSSPSEPILIIISQGSDPFEEINSLATQRNTSIIEITVGEMEHTETEMKLKEASENGKWLLIKNLHLLTTWLPTLEKEFLALGNCHSNFRLLLTTEQHPNFSQSLLDLCLKVTYEAPPGIKHNMERCYNLWHSNGELNKGCPRTFFALAWFHAIVQERRTYIPQGWAKFYEFNDSDLAAATTIVKSMASTNDDVGSNFKYIQGLSENAIYGGRIDNEYDMQVLSSYLQTIFSKDTFNHSGSKGELAPNINLPSSTRIEEHLDIIKKLPEIDPPSYFGLPENVDNSWQKTNSVSVISSLKDLSQDKSTSEKLNIKLWSLNVSPFLKIWKKLHKDANLPNTVNQEGGHSNEPIVSFFILEHAFSIDLVRKVHQSLVLISKVLKGIVQPLPSISEVADALMYQQTPSEWLKQWEGPRNPIKYIRTILLRASSIYAIQKNAATILDKTLDLSIFFNPDSFLDAIKMHCAKIFNSQLDEMSLKLRTGKQAGDLSFMVTGIQLEGAVFQNGKLEKFTNSSKNATADYAFTFSSEKENDSTIRIPLYMTPSREKIISELIVPCHVVDKLAWIKTGVAFYVSGM